MQTGTVKWFSSAKGFGFICPDNGGEEIFAHYTCIQMDGYRTLKAGQKVNYSINVGPKGSHANNIIPIENKLITDGSTISGETASRE